MTDSSSPIGNNGEQKAICTICFEDLKPILEDLQTLPSCGHVFHELCILQWLEYCPAGKKPTCPVCKQSCSRENLTRLYFQSTGDSFQLFSSFSKQDPANADAQKLAEEVGRLETKLASMTVANNNLQARFKKVHEDLLAWKQFTKEEQLIMEEIKKDKENSEQLLCLKMEELSMKTVECTKLQERTLSLAKELATLKLATDLNLEEEDMVRLASIGHGSNSENAADVLKKSLALRNKSYKDLIIQCNILGRSEARACKKLDKAKEKINKLEIRLQEVEKALEEKENEGLRDLKTFSKLKSKHNNSSYLEQNVGFSTIGNQAVKQYATDNSNHFTLSSIEPFDQIRIAEGTEPYKIPSPADVKSYCSVDLNVNSCIHIDADIQKPFPGTNKNPTIAINCKSVATCRDAPPMFDAKSSSMQNTEAHAYTKIDACAAHCKFEDDSKDGEEGSSINIKRNVTYNMNTISTEKFPMDGILKEVPYFAVKKETYACASPVIIGNFSISGSLGPEKVNRSTGKWCRQIQSKSSSGELISVGADGRGGRIKVLKHREECLGESLTAIGSKRHKHGAHQRSQFNIEHFFEKAQTR